MFGHYFCLFRCRNTYIIFRKTSIMIKCFNVRRVMVFTATFNNISFLDLFSVCKTCSLFNLCHRYSARGRSLETGIVPVARYSHQLSSVLLKNSTHWLSNRNSAYTVTVSFCCSTGIMYQKNYILISYRLYIKNVSGQCNFDCSSRISAG
jgi:hypothetical protein